MIVADGQRVVIGMIDGLGTDYFTPEAMPNLARMGRGGIGRAVRAVMPTVTNANNASIACGAPPAAHGITGNSYLDAATGKAEYMESAASLLRRTVIERAASRGIRSALLTCKRKTVHLLGRGAALAVAAEDPPPDLVARHGPPGDIYSREINYWLWDVAADLLARRPEYGLLYVHTTDYPMHMWAPEREESREHLARLDEGIARAASADPGAAFLVTADHGMNAKTRCWDLARACAERGLELRFALSAERDRYVKHHRTFGGTAWVWLRSPADDGPAREILSSLPGVERVLAGAEFAAEFGSLASRIGDLCVLGDRRTVFGEMPHASEDLGPSYRSHGSVHELDIPAVIHNARGRLPDPAALVHNWDLTRDLYPEGG
jgi:phosphonoacetate hydrolase